MSNDRDSKLSRGAVELLRAAGPEVVRERATRMCEAGLLSAADVERRLPDLVEISLGDTRSAYLDDLPYADPPKATCERDVAEEDSSDQGGLEEWDLDDLLAAL
jgi:hypothetical protein